MQFRIKGVFFSLSYPALALISLIVVSNRFFGYLLCFFAVVFHEFGHLFAMMISESHVSAVRINAFNIEIIESDRHNLNMKKDFFITICGPLINLILFALLFRVYRNFALVNLFVGLFNLLPAANLDGGRVLFLLLSEKLNSKKSSCICDAVTLAVFFPLFVLGLLLLFDSKYNFSLLFLSLYLVLSLFLRKDKYI